MLAGSRRAFLRVVMGTGRGGGGRNPNHAARGSKRRRSPPSRLQRNDEKIPKYPVDGLRSNGGLTASSRAAADALSGIRSDNTHLARNISQQTRRFSEAAMETDQVDAGGGGSSSKRGPNPNSRTSSTTLSQITDESFQNLEIHPATKKAMAQAFGYDKMTKVQAATIPVGLSGSDLLAKAKTGTGKTIAFLIPAIDRVAREGRRNPKHISVLVISPTRELAQQIAEEGNALLKYHNELALDCVVGGTNVRGDLHRFQKRMPDILVGTPGRLYDHLDNYGLGRNLEGMKVLILDECDRLLDMGFRRDIEKICQRLPSTRQTVLFSATLPSDVESMCRIALKKSHEFVDCVGKEESTHQHVEQSYVISKMEQQVPDLLEVLKTGMSEKPFKIIVFFTTARLTQFYSELFNLLGVKVLEIHSRKTQGHRNKVSDQFRNGSNLIMFTSDVSARGMDYPDVSLVIQVGMPANREQYIHRLGRTARAGKGGEGVLMLSSFEECVLRDLKDLPLKEGQNATNQESLVRISAALNKLPGATIGAAYQAWLGFYNSNLRKLGWEKEDLVNTANEFAARVCEQDEPPSLRAQTVSKMGLKGVAGLSIERGSAGGGGGGGRGGGGRGGGGRGRGRGRGGGGGGGGGSGGGWGGGGGGYGGGGGGSGGGGRSNGRGGGGRGRGGGGGRRAW